MDRDDLDFRVWDAEAREYTDKWLLTTHGKLADPLDEAAMFYAKPSCLVERSTGCMDSKGIPLYKGDIVITSCFSDKPERMVVCFRKHRFTFEFERNAGALDAEYWPVDDDTAQRCTVVGTIHDKEIDKDEQ